MRALLFKLNLTFADPADEHAFREQFATRYLAIARVFLVLAAIITITFTFWDRMIDAEGARTTVWIRVGLAASLLIVAVALHWRWAKVQFEPIMVIAAVTNAAAGAAICAILVGGFDVVAAGLMLVIMFVYSLFRLRAPAYLLFALLTFVSYLIALQFARGYAPFMPSMNALLIGTGLFIGAVSVIARELSARSEFQAEREIARSHERIEELLHSMLPAEIVARMQGGENLIADVHGEVSIVFSDLVGFTQLSQQVDAPRLVAILNRLFSAFDEAAELHHMHKIKTIGDAYMAVGGFGWSANERSAAHNAAGFSLAMLTIVERLSAELEVPLKVRVGIHVGPVVAGVIGTSRPAFDCWGQSVNIASRLESAAAPGAILLSEPAWFALRDHYTTEVHEHVQLKGIGKVKVYLLCAPDGPTNRNPTMTTSVVTAPSKTALQ